MLLVHSVLTFDSPSTILLQTEQLNGSIFLYVHFDLLVDENVSLEHQLILLSFKLYVYVELVLDYLFLLNWGNKFIFIYLS